MGRAEINSAYSTQPSTARPNPFVSISIDYLLENRSLISSKPAIADQGCGKLRHLPILLAHFDRIYLVDTAFQLNRRQRIFDLEDVTIGDYVTRVSGDGKTVRIVGSDEFDQSKLGLDAIFNVCVFDVEVAHSRRRMISAAYRNLRPQGAYVVIVARNDQSILARCTRKNRYLDGHAFSHHGVWTFYRNFEDSGPLVRSLAEYGFELMADLSVYRHICLIFRRNQLRDKA